MKPLGVEIYEIFLKPNVCSSSLVLLKNSLFRFLYISTPLKNYILQQWTPIGQVELLTYYK